MPSRLLSTIETPSRVAMCGKSLCFRGLAHYLARAVAEANAPIEIVLDCSWDEGAHPAAPADAVVVCASECSEHEDSEVFSRIVESYPGIGIVALSPRAQASHLVEALDAGALGFVACGLDDIGDVISALVGVLHGETSFSNEVSRLIVTSLRDSGIGRPTGAAHRPSAPVLSVREIEVLRLLCDGLSNQQIASVLGLSPNTVKNHLARLYRRLNVSSRAEAVSCSMRLRLV